MMTTKLTQKDIPGDPIVRGWCSLAARRAGGAEVVGSNPTPRTIFNVATAAKVIFNR